MSCILASFCISRKSLQHRQVDGHTMTLSDNVGDDYNEEAEEDLDSFWQRSKDHRTVRFINRSSEWLELKGTLQIGTNRQMTTTTKIPPRSTYVHRFAGKR